MDYTDIAGYKVIERLGAGVMGQVFLVQHPRLPRRDALKLLDAGVSRNDDFKTRFQREADLLALLAHPNIVTLYDRGEFDDRLWLTMEYVDGTDAAELVTSRGALPADLVLSLISGAGSALDYAWRKQGITHRDVKPANILVAFDGDRPETVKLADFGIAKAAGESTSLTATGMTVGTLQYISPEAIEGHRIDNRSDVYSLGCTAYHLLTGHPPFAGETMSALMSAHLTRPVPAITAAAPHLPGAVNQVFATVLAKNPTDRYASCEEFVAALTGTISGAAQDPAYSPTLVASTMPARPTLLDVAQRPAEPAPKKSRLTAVLSAAAAVFAVAAAVLAVLLVRDRSEVTTPVAATSTTSPTSYTTTPQSTVSAVRPAPAPLTTTITEVVPTPTPVVRSPIEGDPCIPGVDERSPDGTLACSGLTGAWRDMSHQSRPSVEWDSPCSEPGARARVTATDAIVTCKPSPSGGYMWQL